MGTFVCYLIPMKTRETLPTGELPQKVLLHACCAPCSAPILEWMLAHGVEPVLFFYNPNIYPQEEYLIRKNELIKYAQKNKLLFLDDDWKHTEWLVSVKGLENEPERGKRCFECFKHRLLATAKQAKEMSISLYTTTLAGSRWKRLDQIRQAASFAKSHVPEVDYWDVNWKKGGLQERRCELLRLNRFYNQQYCGCEFSMRRLQEKPTVEK